MPKQHKDKKQNSVTKDKVRKVDEPLKNQLIISPCKRN